MPQNTLSEMNYNDAEKLMSSEIINKNHKILEKTENTIEDSVMICEEPQIEISPMRTEIYFVPPEFIQNPKNETLKSLSIDINVYRDLYRKLALEANKLSEKALETLHKSYEPSNNVKDEVNKLKSNFEESVKNLCAPLISEQEGLETININSLNENQKKQLEIDKMNIEDQISEFKYESDKLNQLYHKLFENVYDSVIIICDEINDIPKTVSEVQKKIDNGMKEFEDILKEFTNPDDHQKFNQSLKLIKDSLIKLQNNIELFKKSEDIEVLVNKIQKKKDDLEPLKNKSSKILDNLKSKSNSIKDNIIKIRQKYALEPVELPELNCSNIIIDSIINTINSSLKSIKKENLDLKKGVENISINFDELEKVTTLDLLFIMDITSSMNTYVELVKKNIINIIEKIPNKCPGVIINMGFIGYRDVCKDFENNGIKEEEFVDIDFTSNYEELKNSIENIEVSGGGDDAEDIAFAMELALKKSWNNSARFAILFADDPCHGSEFHDEKISDNYSSGIPGRRNIKDIIEELARKNISLYCTEIKENTKIMYEKFKDIYNNYNKCEFNIFPLNERTDIAESVGNACSKIYSEHRQINI